MLPKEFQHFTAIPARLVRTDPRLVPNLPAAYTIFFTGGRRLLETSGYFNLEASRPLVFRRRTHLYTGAAMNLRDRLKQHTCADLTSSSLRFSLLAMEQCTAAISSTKTAACEVAGERSLSKWIDENGLLCVAETDDPFGLEQELLDKHASPLNIAHRTDRPFAKALSRWRRTSFPSWQPEKARQIRHL